MDWVFRPTNNAIQCASQATRLKVRTMQHLLDPAVFATLPDWLAQLAGVRRIERAKFGSGCLPVGPIRLST